jgi:hypothetical protein
MPTPVPGDPGLEYLSNGLIELLDPLPDGWCLGTD